jgi:hypothetical protein
MTIKSYLWGMRISTFLALGGFVAVVIFIDPQKSGILGQVLFYLSLILALSGILILILMGLHRRPNDEEQSLSYLGSSFRQGILLSLLAAILLALQGFRVLTWWDGLLVAAAIFLIELYFISR